MSLNYFTRRDAQAACDECHGPYQWQWTGKNAQGVAARHAKLTGHTVRVEIDMVVVYSSSPNDQQVTRTE